MLNFPEPRQSSLSFVRVCFSDGGRTNISRTPDISAASPAWVLCAQTIFMLGEPSKSAAEQRVRVLRLRSVHLTIANSVWIYGALAQDLTEDGLLSSSMRPSFLFRFCRVKIGLESDTKWLPDKNVHPKAIPNSRVMIYRYNFTRKSDAPKCNTWSYGYPRSSRP